MAKYDISREATEDLYSIWEYTVDTWSEDQAPLLLRYLLDLEFNLILSQPTVKSHLSHRLNAEGRPIAFNYLEFEAIEREAGTSIVR